MYYCWIPEQINVKFGINIHKMSVTLFSGLNQRFTKSCYQLWPWLILWTLYIYIDENQRSIIHFCIGQLKITMKVLILLAVVIGNIFTLNTCILHFLQQANGTRIIFIWSAYLIGFWNRFYLRNGIIGYPINTSINWLVQIALNKHQ